MGSNHGYLHHTGGLKRGNKALRELGRSSSRRRGTRLGLQASTMPRMPIIQTSGNPMSCELHRPSQSMNVSLGWEAWEVPRCVVRWALFSYSKECLEGMRRMEAVELARKRFFPVPHSSMMLFLTPSQSAPILLATNSALIAPLNIFYPP